MADEDLQMALSYFPHALIYPAHGDPENGDRRLDEGTARMIQRIRKDRPEHVIVVAG